MQGTGTSCGGGAGMGPFYVERYCREARKGRVVEARGRVESY
jgi:hypothetical protein